jgi:uncharacterized protein YcbK (DUF882 family)
MLQRLAMRTAFAVWLLTCLPAMDASAASPARYFHSGDGRLNLASDKNEAVFAGVYRTGRDGYDPAAMAAIHRVFGAPYTPGAERLSRRLIEFIDFLEDRLNPGGRITIVSGYRAPAYNRMLRARGALAAKASLHQYGMAADLRLAGVSARRVWETVKALGFGGAGYYHGDSVHVDVGPARSWDEKTSGVGTGISDDNKLIGLVADYDIYRPGEPLDLRFIRMTAFPIGVQPVFALARQGANGTWGPVQSFTPAGGPWTSGACPQFNDIEHMAGFAWRLPADLPPGRYTVEARFCESAWPQMPATVATPEFEVVRP